MDDKKLREILEYLLQQQETRRGQLAEYDAQEALLMQLASSGRMPSDPVFLKMLNVMAVVRASDQMSARAVDELAELVDSRRGQQ